MRRKNHGYSFARKHQWGAERRLKPLSIVHDRPSTNKIAMSRIAVVLTIALWVLYVIAIIIRQFFDGPRTFQFAMQAIVYLVVVTFLTFSALMYLIARQGALERFSKHVRVPRAEIDRHFSDKQPSITVLVPSYSEEPQVIRKTLLSAALQEYPDLRIVLLVDDKPYPTNPAVLAQLEETRRLGEDLSDFLREPRERFKATLDTFERQYQKDTTISPRITKKLADEYLWAAVWLETKAKTEVIEDHVDVFFSEQVLLELAKELRLIGDALMASEALM